MSTRPSIEVVIPTRNRPDQIVPCVESVLASVAEFRRAGEHPGDDVQVVVIDQSDDDGTQRALDEVPDRAGVQYVRTSSRGAARARNEGAEIASAALLAFTDDDCRVSPSWLVSIAQAFDTHPNVGIVYGRVALPVDMPQDSFAASFDGDGQVFRGKLPGPETPWGIGANMAVRRDVFFEVGGLDPNLGAGTVLQAGEESDLMVRVIAAGYAVVCDRESSVLHLGIRSGADASAIVRGYALGLGAVFCKHARLRTHPGRGQLPLWLWHFGRLGAIRLVRRERPTGLGFVKGLLMGAWQAKRLPIDRERGVFET